jgi:hypothetical protein
MYIQELPSNQFTYWNYNAGIPYEVFMTDDKLIGWLLERTIEGYQRYPEFKPQTNFVALLIIDKEDEEKNNLGKWSHIPERVFQKLLKL